MKETSKAGILLGAFVFTSFCAIAVMNGGVDCVNTFHKTDEKIAEALLDGKSVYITMDTNHRKLKSLLLKDAPVQTFDSIALGSSLVMPLTKEAVHAEHFYNLGVSNGDLYDYMNMLGLLQTSGKSTKNVVIALDGPTFNKELIAKNSIFFEREKYAHYGAYFQNYLNNEPYTIKPNGKYALQVAKQLCSIAYFKNNLTYLKKHHYSVQERFGAWKEGLPYAGYHPDGSLTYDQGTEQRTVEDVLQDAQKQKGTWNHIHIDTDCVKMVDRIIRYFLKNNTHVILYLPPLAPAFWEIVTAEKWNIFSEIDDFARAYENIEGIEVFGSFNPADLGMQNEHFYDARHVRAKDMGTAFRKK